MSEQQKNQYNNPPADEISLKELILKIKELLLYLKTKWKIIFLIGIIGAILDFGYAYFEKPAYTATLTFAMEEEKNVGGGLGGALGLASSLGFDLGTGAGGAFSSSNLIELMKSRRLVEQTLLNPVIIEGKQVSLAGMYIRMNSWGKKLIENNHSINEKQLQYTPGTDRSQFTLQQDSVLGIMYDRIIKKNLIVMQKDKKVSIISVDVKTEDELFSKYFAEILAKEVSDFYIDTKSKKAKMNVAILERQADSVRAELNNAINGVAVANDNTYNLNPALNVKRTPSARRQVDVQANMAILTELVKNLVLAKVTLRKETPLIQIIDKPILPLKKEKSGKLKSLMVGGVLAGFFSLLFFICRRGWKEIWVP